MSIQRIFDFPYFRSDLLLQAHDDNLLPKMLELLEYKLSICCVKISVLNIVRKLKMTCWQNITKVNENGNSNFIFVTSVTSATATFILRRIWPEKFLLRRIEQSVFTCSEVLLGSVYFIENGIVLMTCMEAIEFIQRGSFFLSQLLFVPITATTMIESIWN